MKSTGLFPLAAYALFPAYGYAGRGGRREERGKKGAEGGKSKVFYSLNIGPNQTPSAVVRI